MMQPQDLEWRIASALGSPHRRSASVSLLQPVLAVLTLVVLLLAPVDATARLTPIVGTIGLGIECIYLLRLVFRMQLTLLTLERQGSEASSVRRSAMRRSMLPAVNALGGLLIFTAMFYPLSHSVIESAAGTSAGRLLWLLTVGAAIVALAFGQLVSLLLDVVRQQTAQPDPVVAAA